MATGGDDGEVIVYDLQTATPGKPDYCSPLAIGDCKGDAVTAVVWGDGDVLFSGHESGAVRRWKGAPTRLIIEEESSSSDEEMLPEE